MHSMDSIAQDTIFALASGTLPAGIAVIRLSGPQTRFALETMTGPVGLSRQAELRSVRAQDGALLDRGLRLWFPGPSSFTGEDYAELHLHGGRAVVASVIAALSAMDHIRSAEAGEFTLRAFSNGRIDLTNAEALADLVDAETEEQRRFALDNSGDRHGLLYDNWRSRIVDLLSEMTAAIDFADEEDVERHADDNGYSDVAALIGEIDSHVERFHAGEIIRRGFRVALIGAPNAGKSSLLNALAGRDAAIVTDEPGTTRDVVEVALDLGGYKILLQDTAGLRSDAGTVEQIGIERALQAARDADLVLHLVDIRERPSGQQTVATDAPVVMVGSKSDLNSSPEDHGYEINTSTVNETGLDQLLGYLTDAVANAAGGPELMPFRQRHVDLLVEARSALLESKDASMIELKAELLQRAANSLGRITGKVDVEDLLDVIFSRFCIGK